MTTTLTGIAIAGLTGVPAAACAPLALGVALLLVLRAARRSIRLAMPATETPTVATDEIRRAA